VADALAPAQAPRILMNDKLPAAFKPELPIFLGILSGFSLSINEIDKYVDVPK